MIRFAALQFLAGSTSYLLNHINNCITGSTFGFDSRICDKFIQLYRAPLYALVDISWTSENPILIIYLFCGLCGAI
jgi:hypothetical protein